MITITVTQLPVIIILLLFTNTHNFIKVNIPVACGYVKFFVMPVTIHLPMLTKWRKLKDFYICILLAHKFRKSNCQRNKGIFSRVSSLFIDMPKFLKKLWSIICRARLSQEWAQGLMCIQAPILNRPKNLNIFDELKRIIWTHKSMLVGNVSLESF